MKSKVTKTTYPHIKNHLESYKSVDFMIDVEIVYERDN